MIEQDIRWTITKTTRRKPIAKLFCKNCSIHLLSITPTKKEISGPVSNIIDRMLTGWGEMNGNSGNVLCRTCYCKLKGLKP